MKKDDFIKAKKIEADIKELEHILRCLEPPSNTYTIGMFCASSCENSFLNRNLGRDFLDGLTKQTIDALTLKKLKLEQEFMLLVEP